MPEARWQGPAREGGAAPAEAMPRPPRGIWQKVKLLALASALAGFGWTAPLAAGADCIRLGSGFDFCPEGSDWAAAEWEATGDSSDVILGNVFFWFTGAWGGRPTPKPGAPLPPLATELAALLEWSREEIAPGEQVLLLRDQFAAGEITAERAIRRVVLPEPPPAPLLRATMIVAGPGDTRLMLALQGAESVRVAEIDRRSREIVALLRPRQEK